MTWKRTAAFGVLVGLAACGGKGNPAAPTASPVTVTGVTISTFTDMLRVGVPEVFAATATHSDGSVSNQITWSTSDPTVASVDATGRVTGLKNGQVDVIAAHQSATARKTVRVVPNYQGTWQGRYQITGCTQTGDYALIGFCTLFSVGTTAPIQLVLTQNRDTVSGTLYLGSMSTTANAPIDSNGHMALVAGQIPASYAVTISNWDTVATPDDRMTGHFTQDWRYTSGYMAGIGRFDVELLAVTKTSGSTVLTAIEPVMAQTLEEMARAMGIR
jgi:hypothetical protein